MAKKIENMSAEEFSAHIADLDDDAFMETWTEFGRKVQEGRERLLEFSRVHQRRVRLEQLSSMRLSEADLKLLQECGPVGIESQESVNGDADRG